MEEAVNELSCLNVGNVNPISHDEEVATLETDNILTDPNEWSLEAVVDFVQQVWDNNDRNFLSESNVTIDTEIFFLQ